MARAGRPRPAYGAPAPCIDNRCTVKKDKTETDASFDWDESNVSHLAWYRIEPSGITEVFRNGPVIRGYETVDDEDRWTLVGVTDELRVLVVVFTLRRGRIRPITAWDADRRTKKEYFAGKVT